MSTRDDKSQERIDAHLFRKRQEGVQYKSERFIPTADDWHPCFDSDGHGTPMVRASVMMQEPSGFNRYWNRSNPHAEEWFVRICFWGADDTGIEKDFYFQTREEAFEQYQRLINYMNNIVVVQYHQLLKLGFVHA